MGAQAASLTASLANPTYNKSELVHQLKDSGVSVLFTASEVFQTAADAAAEAGIGRDRVFALPKSDGTYPSGAQPYEKLLSNKLWKHEPIPREKLATTPACESHEASQLITASDVSAVSSDALRGVIALSRLSLLLGHYWSQQGCRRLPSEHCGDERDAVPRSRLPELKHSHDVGAALHAHLCLDVLRPPHHPCWRDYRRSASVGLAFLCDFLSLHKFRRLRPPLSDTLSLPQLRSATIPRWNCKVQVHLHLHVRERSRAWRKSP